MNKNLKGISLIVLVITIIVMIIIAGAIILSLNSSNIVEKAKIAKIKTNVSGYNTELSMYIANKQLEDNNFKANSINASGEGLKTYIPSILEADTLKFEIQSGKLFYIGTDDIEKTAIQEIGINSGNINIEYQQNIGIFNIDDTYNKIYINPNPIRPIENLTDCMASGYNTIDNEEISGFVIFSTEKVNAAVPCVALIVNQTPDNNNKLYLYLYFWENYTGTVNIGVPIEGTFNKGWNKAEVTIIDNSITNLIITQIAHSDLPILTDVGKIANIDGNYPGVTTLGLYASTNPYVPKE